MNLEENIDSESSVTSFVRSEQFRVFLNQIGCHSSAGFLADNNFKISVHSLHIEATAQKEKNVGTLNSYQKRGGVVRYILIVKAICLIEIAQGNRAEAYQCFDYLRSAYKYYSKIELKNALGTILDRLSAEKTQIGEHNGGCPLCFIEKCRRFFESGTIKEHAVDH